MPFIFILKPNNEGKTALELVSVNKKNQKTFELMINLLDGYDYCCLTRMMLPVMETIITKKSTFFETAIYKPKLMKEEI